MTAYAEYRDGGDQGCVAPDDFRWRTALEGNDQGVWDIDHTARTRYHSPAWYRLRGLNPADEGASGHEAWTSRIHPEDLPVVLAQIDEQRRSNADHIEMKYRERHADGHYIWILSRGTVVRRGPDGISARNIGTDTDITEIENSQGTLNRLSHRMELALSTSKIGVWEFDLKNMIAHWDARTRELFGVDSTRFPLPPDIWERSIHPDDRKRATSTAENTVLIRGSYDMTYRVVLPWGQIRYLRCCASYYEDPVNGPRLVGVNWDVTEDFLRAQELERARAAMEHSALHDAMTGLANRRQLDQRLAEITAKGNAARVALLHIDLDRFKHINDTLGHAAGDAILKHVALVLKGAVVCPVLVARTGGDEFVLLIENAPDDTAIAGIASSIVARLREPLMHEGHECRYGSSIGIAVIEGRAVDGRELLVNADIALYRAKNEGRNRWCFFTSEMQVSLLKHKRCADDLLHGLDHGEFFPIYQLQFDAETQNVVGAEALVRWRHPERGVLAPDEFLQVADDICVVSRIDETILTTALTDLALWRQQGIEIPRVSVNVSSRRLRDVHLLEKLKELRIPPGSVSFELLESIYLDGQNEYMDRHISEIRNLGIGIEIDDFGKGHASIAGLLKLRPSRFKIARELVKPVVVSVEQRRLLSSIIDIGKALGIEVVAEGVETADHARILKALHCDVFQGYAFARPMQAGEIAGFIAGNQWRRAA